MKYVKRPIAVEAIQLPNSGKHREFEDWLAAAPEWVRDGISSMEIMFDPIHNAGLYIKTLEGEMLCKWGNYIIRGIKGEIYPCRRDIFEETYDTVDNEELDHKEIVHCKVCMYRPVYNTDDNCPEVLAPRDHTGWCDDTCPFTCGDEFYNEMPDDDFYCKYGERG